jgi:hypothetical protein
VIGNQIHCDPRQVGSLRWQGIARTMN